MKFSKLLALMVILTILLGVSSALAAEKVTISWLLTSGRPHENEIMQNLAKEFENKNPDIGVDVIFVAWKEFETKLATMYAAGAPGDVWFTAAQYGLRHYAHEGVLLELDPYIERDNYDLSDFDESILASLTWGGKRVGIPIATFPLFMIYNKTIFDEAGVSYPPLDWDDASWDWYKFVDYAKKLTKDTNGDGKTDQWGTYYKLRAVEFAWIWGGDWFTKEAYDTGLAKECIADSPEVIKGLQLGADLIHVDKVMPSPAEYQTIQALGDPFLTSKVAMVEGSTWNFVDYDQIKAFEWDIAAAPRGTQPATILYTDPWMIAEKSKNPDEAWEFVKFLAMPETELTLSKGRFTAIPARKSIRQTFLEGATETIPLDHLQKVIEGAYKYGKTYPSHALFGFAEVENVTNAELDPLWLGKKTAEECVKAFVPKVNKILAEIETK